MGEDQEEDTNSARSDFAATKAGIVVLWGFPAAVLIASGVYEALSQAIYWPLSFLWMAAACGYNAVRCRRVHCYFTAPLFFLLAVASGLHGFGILGLGGNGWTWIAWAAIVGSIILVQFPEYFLGRYGKKSGRTT